MFKNILAVPLRGYLAYQLQESSLDTGSYWAGRVETPGMFEFRHFKNPNILIHFVFPHRVGQLRPFINVPLMLVSKALSLTHLLQLAPDFGLLRL